MSTTETAIVSEANARKALEAFITDNPELESLEGLLAQFNIFEALGAVRHEVRHSDFLAYLLNPQENHGLGDAFIKRLLQKSIAAVERTDLPVTLIDLDFWDLDTATIQREWQRIDIFLRDELHQFSVIIENKIDTGEHNDQLSRYYERVQREFPNDRILALYLTKEGDEPSDGRYLPLGYGLVCEAVENLAERRASTLGRDVHTLMVHYAQMLRRHIMSDTEIARLCGLIYQKHRAALDLIYEHRPNQQAAMTQFLEELIEQTVGVQRGETTRGRYVVFRLPELTGIPSNALYFVFDNASDSLTLRMQICTYSGHQETCRNVFEFASAHQPPFNLDRRSMKKVFSNIFTRVFLGGNDYVQADSQEREGKIRDNWKQFLQRDLPPIRQALAEADWIYGGEAEE
jgi:hypothetical protein